MTALQDVQDRARIRQPRFPSLTERKAVEGKSLSKLDNSETKTIFIILFSCELCSVNSFHKTQQCDVR